MEAGLLKPQGFQLYDFGGGQYVAPCPDLDGSGYLTTHLVAVEDGRQPKATAVKVQYSNLSEITLREALERAVQAYDKQQVQFAIIP